MLLTQGMPKEALAAFEATLAKEPNRLNAVAGAANAAKALGDQARARGYYQRIAVLEVGGNADRGELIAAREFLSKN
jgi:hypothetical protein